jgi:hypothetical protein
VRLSVDRILPSAARVDGAGERVTIEGRARVSEVAPYPTDVILLIDASEDSAGVSGADVDGDGRVSRGRGLRFRRGLPTLGLRGSGDSILAAEVLAARRTAALLDPVTARAAVVAIGQPYDTNPCEHGPIGPGARLIVPLTSDRARVEEGLDRVLADGPKGASNLAEGIRLSVSTLAGLPDTASTARARAERVVVLFGHRAPTFPFGSPFHTSPEDVELAAQAAGAAGRTGVRLEALAFGGLAGEAVGTLEAIAAEAGGRLERVSDPRAARLGMGAGSAVASLSVLNESTREEATDVSVLSDGTWRATLPLAPGANRIRVRARARDGSEREARLVLHGDGREPRGPLKPSPQSRGPGGPSPHRDWIIVHHGKRRIRRFLVLGEVFLPLHEAKAPQNPEASLWKAVVCPRQGDEPGPR